MKIRQIVLRASLLLLVIIPAFRFWDFYNHFRMYLLGYVAERVLRERWLLVLTNVLFFSISILFLSFRRKVNWSERGVVIAFFISLFFEMYGIPFTMLFISSFISQPHQGLNKQIFRFRFFDAAFGMDLPMVFSAIIIALGFSIIIIAWVSLYRNISKNKIVQKGIYAYSRHPQYLGFILIVVGWLIGWPTLITFIFSPILLYHYIRLCKTEEIEIERSYPDYAKYRKKVPFFI